MIDSFLLHLHGLVFGRPKGRRERFRSWTPSAGKHTTAFAKLWWTSNGDRVRLSIFKLMTLLVSKLMITCYVREAYAIA